LIRNLLSSHFITSPIIEFPYSRISGLGSSNREMSQFEERNPTQPVTQTSFELLMSFFSKEMKVGLSSLRLLLPRDEESSVSESFLLGTSLVSARHPSMM